MNIIIKCFVQRPHSHTQRGRLSMHRSNKEHTNASKNTRI